RLLSTSSPSFTFENAIHSCSSSFFFSSSCLHINPRSSSLLLSSLLLSLEQSQLTSTASFAPSLFYPYFSHPASTTLYHILPTKNKRHPLLILNHPPLPRSAQSLKDEQDTCRPITEPPEQKTDNNTYTYLTMSTSHDQESTHEQVADIVVSDGATTEPEPTPEILEETPLQATTTATSSPPKPSRLSMAFNRLSCGFCFHPYKNNLTTDYHALVHTPTEEDGPILGFQDDDDDYSPEDGEEYPAFETTEEDFKDEYGIQVGSSSSADQEPSSEEELKARATSDLQVTSAIEEDAALDSDDQSETGPSESATNLVQETDPDQETDDSHKGISLDEHALITAVTTTVPHATPVVTTTGKKEKPNKPSRFKSLTKLGRRSSSSASNSPSTSTPSSPPASPLLLGRITSRFSKITRSKQASATTSCSSLTSKVDDLKVTAITTTTAVEEKTSSKQDLHVDIHETVTVDSDENEPVILTDEPLEMQLPAAQPVAIPGSADAWPQSPTSHHTDASASTAGSGQTLVKLGRSSTVGSTVGGESETGSVKSSGSGKEAKEVQPQQETKRKGSMMKKIEKIGKIIKNEKRKSTGDSYLSKFSRRGSATMQSPVAVEENKGH
ncbi:MAG: hypothetical protein J3Q66DRAFT_138031, partial [Benniella sp.]